MISSRGTEDQRGYLLKQTLMILLLSYLILAGGTLNGLLRFHLHVASHVLVAIILIAWIGGALWHRRNIESTGLEWPILIIFAIQLLTTLLSTDLRRSLGWFGMMILYALFFYLVHDLSKHGWSASLMVKSLLIVGGIVIAWGVVDILAWYLNWLSQSGGRLIPTEPLRLYTLLGDANMLAGFLNLLLPLAIIRFINTRRSLSRLILLGWLAGNLLVQFFASSRGGWLGTIVVFGTLVVLITGAFGGWMDRLKLWWKAGRSRRWMILVAIVGLICLVPVAYLAWGQLQHPTHGSIWDSRRLFWGSSWETFKSYPLYGSGPFTYSTQLMEYKLFLDRPFPHAHSLPMTVLAEGGLLGMSSLFVLVFFLYKRLWSIWRFANFEQRLFMSGGLASLFGFCVHSLVDNHILVPTIGMTAVGIAALTISGGSEGEKREPAMLQMHGIHPLWLLIPSVLLVTGSVWSDWAYHPFWRGVEASRSGDWKEAATFFDAAVERDNGLPFYHLQQGYAWGMLADESVTPDETERQKALENAIAAYERGVAVEPRYSLNHANLSVLYWQAGEREKAVDEMLTAIEQTPDVAPYYLNMGGYAEEMGRQDDAISFYGKMLDLRPDLADAGHFWRQSPVKREALTRWQEAHPVPPVPESPQTYDDYLRVGRDAFEREDWTAAQDAFLQARSMSPSRLEAYDGLAQANMALGDYIRAESFLRRGLNIFTQEVDDKLPLLLTYGEVAYRQGRFKDAVKRHETALRMVEQPTIYGRGSIGWSPYGWFVFQRESIEPDMLPQLERLEMTDTLAVRFLELARWYEELGEVEKAAETYRRILAIVPDFEPALEGLSLLEEE